MDDGAGRQARDFVAAWQPRGSRDVAGSEPTRTTGGRSRAAMPEADAWAGTRDPDAPAAMPDARLSHRLHGLPSKLPWTERRRSKGEQPQESRGSGDGSPASPGSRDPEARVDRDVTPFKGVRGDPAIKARIGSGGFELWRGQTPRRDRRPAHGGSTSVPRCRHGLAAG